MNKSGMFSLKAQDTVLKSRDGTEIFSIKKETCFRKLATKLLCRSLLLCICRIPSPHLVSLSHSDEGWKA